MSYVKNYNVGSIRLDAPYTHFIYELPLLSFGDIQHNVNLSLVHLFKSTDDLENTDGEYKLNLQKRLIKSNDTGPFTHYEEGNGTKIKLIKYGYTGLEVYLFNDKSKRVIRKKDGEFILENPDYSREIYDSYGNILKIIDKYGNAVLTYEYTVDSTRLDKIIYREDLVTSGGLYKRFMQFAYSSSNQINEIKYYFNGVEQCKIDFVYDNSELETIKHYSGVNYSFMQGIDSFSVCSYDDGSDYSSSVDHYQKITCDYPLYDTITIEKLMGDKVIDRVKYHPITPIYNDVCEIWDVEDFAGVRKRVVFDGDYPKYSYEVVNVSTDSTPNYDVKFVNNDTRYYGNVSYYNNDDIIGGQSRYDGLFMSLHNGNTWRVGLSAGEGTTGVFTLSGWIKPSANNMPCTFNINGIPLSVRNYNQQMWTYFTYTFYGENFTEINVYAECAAFVDMKDFRITYQEMNLLSEDATNHIVNTEDVLINSSGEIIPFKDVTFAYFKAGGFITINENVSCADVLKYKLNKNKSTAEVDDEIYYNDVKGVITSASDLRVRYNGTDSNISNYSVGKRFYSNSKIYVTRNITNPTESGAWLKIETTCNGTVISSELYDEYMNVISSTKDGVTTTYVRNAAGLVTKQTINGNIITETKYNDSFSRMLWSKDEFEVKTYYTTNEVWGVVTKALVNDTNYNTVVETEETFDSDFTDKLSTKFQKGSDSKTNTIGYENDKIKNMEDGELEYGFAYDHNYTHSSTDSNGNAVSDESTLLGISKCGSLIEQNVFKDDKRKITTAYPSLSNPLYTVVERLDKYGRVERIDGKLKNTYDVHPGKYENGNFFTVGDSGENALLATSEDLTNGKKTKFAYLSDQLKLATVFNSSGTKLTTESFEYDDLNRMKSDKFTYETGKAVKLEIEYDTSTTAVTPDNRVKKYTYKIGDDNTIDNTIDDVKATINNSYADAFKRLTRKEIEVGSASYKKSIIYDKTRIKRVMDVKGGSTLHNVSYSYDAMGRIISESDTADTSFKNTYTYDTFGQLIRENNKALDKTYVYEYNGSGNIIGAKTYSYTTGALDGVNPTTTDSYAYDSTVKDRLTAFKGDAITYNSMGCPIKLVDGSTTYTYTWTKGKLTGFAKFSSLGGRHSYTYTYDAYGRRIRKLYTYAPGSQISAVYTTRVTTNYTYDLSGRLIREQVTETDNQLATYQREFLYLYDGDNIVGVEFTRNGTTSTYYFDRNIKGDVVGIFNSSGTQVAKYEYDAWGNSRLSTLVSNNFSGYNSIRYRGYYYDTETGFYFLNSRYYSPQWRRFISPASASSLNPNSVNGLNLYCYAGNNPVGVAYNNSVASAIDSGDFTRSTAGIGNAISTDSLAISKGRLSLPAVPWLVDNATTIYGAVSSLSIGFPILSHYFKYASVINDEFKLYGISKWKTSLQLSNVSFKMGTLDGILIGVNVLLDMYDSYQRGVSTEGIMVGGALTAATGVGMFYLNKGIMWAATTIGTAICPGLGTGIGFAVGLGISLFVDWKLGEWIADWIDSVAV